MRRFVFVLLVGCDANGSKAAPLLDAPFDTDTALICTHIQQLKTFQGRVVSVNTQKTYSGEVCVEGRTDLACATPLSDGSFTMCVPSGGDFGLRFTQQGFEKTVYLHGPTNLVSGSGSGAFTITDDTFAGTSIWGAIGGSYPPTTTGHLVIVGHTDTARLADATYALAPTATIVYLGANNLPDSGRMTTTTSGVAFVSDLAPGNYDIEVTQAMFPTCAFLTGGYKSPDMAQRARVPVIAGVTTVAQLRCMP